eukprot:4946014-Lingulodinium_polyedra.AAC.1
MRTRGVIASHGRAELDPADCAGLGPLPPESLPKPLFTTKGHELTVDGATLTQRRVWPSFSPQGAMGLHAQRALLQHCLATGRWASASQCWFSGLLQP